MIERLPYDEINGRAVGQFAAVGKHLSSIDDKLKALVELRVSQINGCVYCLDLHARQARELGESQQRLDCLAAWQEYPYFSDREKAAFAWAEAVTNISETHASDDVYNQLLNHFNEQEVVDLSFIIVMMNGWNRLAIAFRQLPDAYRE